MRRLLLVLLFACAMPAAAQMYKCVDERGRTHYTDKMAPGCKGGAVDIQGQAPISGKVTPYKEDLNRSEREFQQREKQRVREEEAAARTLAAERKRCDSLRGQHQRLASQRRPANAEAHDAALRNLAGQIEKCRS
jgi:hypothetical protein